MSLNLQVILDFDVQIGKHDSAYHSKCKYHVAGFKDVVDNRGFQEALYIIDIGQNDLADSFAKHLTYAEVVAKIPSVVTEIKLAITVSNNLEKKTFTHI